MYLDAAGQPTIVLNSFKSSVELLERRAINYSDRPRLIMAQDILSQGLQLSLMRHSDRRVPRIILYNETRRYSCLRICVAGVACVVPRMKHSLRG